jgi:hypothetical protein
MGKTISSYLSYYSLLEDKFMKKKLILEEKLIVEMTDKKMLSEQSIRRVKASDSLSSREKEKQIAAIKEETNALVSQLSSQCTTDITSLRNDFEGSLKLLVDAYEQYLTTIDPSPRYLPLTVNVRLPSHNIYLKSILLKPTDTTEDLKSKVQERLTALDNPLHDFGSSPVFTLFPLFGDEGNDDIAKGKEKKKERVKSKEKEKEKEKEKSSTKQTTDKNSHGIIIPNHIAIVLCCHPPPPQNSTITISGDLVLTSDRPKVCFAMEKSTFVKGESMCNYFMCTQCNLNWLCQSCATVCHDGHPIKEFLLNNKPSFACCYCKKSKKCKLEKK